MTTAAEVEQISLAMTTAAEIEPPFQLLLRLLDLPDGFFDAEVLRRLGPTDLASLAGTGHALAAAVAATALMTWAKHDRNLVNLPPRPHATYGHPAPRLCVREACSLAARDGHLEALTWLHSTGCPWDSATCYFAAEGGHLAMLKWLHNTGCPWDSKTCRAAAVGGHFEVLKWLHNQGCPWDASTCSAAAKDGNSEMLTWLHSTGCPLAAETRDAAAAGGHLEVEVAAQPRVPGRG